MTRFLLVAFVLGTTAPALAQTAEDLSGKVDSTITTEVQTQELKDGWATEKAVETWESMRDLVAPRQESPAENPKDQENV